MSRAERHHEITNVARCLHMLQKVVTNVQGRKTLSCKITTYGHHPAHLVGIVFKKNYGEILLLNPTVRTEAPSEGRGTQTGDRDLPVDRSQLFGRSWQLCDLYQILFATSVWSKVLCWTALFGSTCRCEEAFLYTKMVKSRYRRSPNDKHLKYFPHLS